MPESTIKSIKEFARLANCSISTVSKALNGKQDVSAKTRKKILELAEAHNFAPNAFGKALKNKRTENIGIVFGRTDQPLLRNPFYSRVLEGIEAELAINNFNLLLHLLPEGEKFKIPKMLKEGLVDGVILVGILKTAMIEFLQERQIPAVLIDPQIRVDGLSQVCIDNEHGGFQATQFLLDRGHTRIGFISGDLKHLSFKQRYDGYCKALNFNHIEIDPDLVRIGALEAGYDLVHQLLILKSRPSAIFSANDINAILGYKAVKDFNLGIPEDISVIGFDDIDLASISSPPLTTIRVYKEEMGSIAVRILIEMIGQPEPKPLMTLVPTRIVERESVRFLN